MLLAHRVSWELYRGKIPAGLCVLHRCDNPSCVNPEHLFLGTKKDNALDREHKGRGRLSHGEFSGFNKVTNEQVLEIRNNPETSRKIAPKYGISDRMVRYIKSRSNWKHI